MAKKKRYGAVTPAIPAAEQPIVLSFKTTLLCAMLLLIATTLAYLNSFKGAFLLDDGYLITDDVYIRQFWPPSFWLSDPRGISRPLVTGTIAANFALGGFNTFGYHLVNLVVHLVSGLALFGIVRRTLISQRLRATFAKSATPLALIVAGLWMLHPLNTQAVTYIIQRCESMMGLFFLLTFYCVIRGFDSKRAWMWNIAAALFGIMGAGCKQVIVAALPLIWLYDSIFLTGSYRGTLRRWGVYAGLAISWVVVLGMQFALPRASSAGFGFTACTPSEYAQTQFGVISHYIWLGFWPGELCFDYCWQLAQSSAEVVPYALFIIALLVATGIALWRAPAWGFLGAWFFVILAPTSSIMPIADLCVEHRMYLPLIAIICAAVFAVFFISRQIFDRPGTTPAEPRKLRWTAALPVVLVAAALAARTVARNEDYASALNMWSLIVQQRPGNPHAWCNQGLELWDKGEREQKPELQERAIANYQHALAMAPNMVEAYGYLGDAFSKKNRLDEAITNYQKVLELKPGDINTRNNLGNLLFRRSRFDEAVEQYQKVLEANKNFAEAHNNLGCAYAKQNKIELSMAEYEEALRLKWEYPDAQNNLGNMLVRLGKTNDAIPHFREAAKSPVKAAEALCNIGNVFMQQHKAAEAVVEYQAALQARPGSAELHTNLGAALAAQNKAGEAIAHFEEALKIRPDYQPAKDNLNRLQQQKK